MWTEICSKNIDHKACIGNHSGLDAFRGILKIAVLGVLLNRSKTRNSEAAHNVSKSLSMIERNVVWSSCIRFHACFTRGTDVYDVNVEESCLTACWEVRQTAHVIPRKRTESVCEISLYFFSVTRSSSWDRALTGNWLVRWCDERGDRTHLAFVTFSKSSYSGWDSSSLDRGPEYPSWCFWQRLQIPWLSRVCETFGPVVPTKSFRWTKEQGRIKPAAHRYHLLNKLHSVGILIPV